MPKKEKKSKRDIGKKELHRLLYDIFSGNPDQSFNYKQLAQRLGIKNMNAKQLIMTVLYEMKNDNMLTEESTGVFKFKVNTIYVTGIIDLTAKGTAYLISDDCQEDVFIPQVGLNHALNGDKVKVLLYARSSKRAPKGKWWKSSNARKKHSWASYNAPNNTPFSFPRANNYLTIYLSPWQT